MGRGGSTTSTSTKQNNKNLINLTPISD